jgi:phage recombination protein Bet
MTAITAITKLGDEQRALLARTLCQGATTDEMSLFFAICDRTGLDPFARQIYAVKRWDSRARREVMQTQVSIDGARLTAQRSNEYAGQDGPYWCGADGVWKDVWLSSELPMAAKVGVMRRGFAQPLYGVALFAEYAQRNKEGHLTAMWSKMPAVMIAKCAEMIALRKGFPAELSGLYAAEEMSQATTPAVEAEVVHVLPAPAPAQEMPQAEQESGDAPKPTRKRATRQDVAAAPETPVAPAIPAKPVDGYPDEYEGVFQIHRVVRRPGRPVAIEATGEHGKVWIATSVGEYADLAEDNVNGEMTIEVARIGQTMQVMRVVGPIKPVEVNSEEVPF